MFALLQIGATHPSPGTWLSRSVSCRRSLLTPNSGQNARTACPRTRVPSGAPGAGVLRDGRLTESVQVTSNVPHHTAPHDLTHTAPQIRGCRGLLRVDARCYRAAPSAGAPGAGVLFRAVGWIFCGTDVGDFLGHKSVGAEELGGDGWVLVGRRPVEAVEETCRSVGELHGDGCVLVGRSVITNLLLLNQMLAEGEIWSNTK